MAAKAVIGQDTAQVGVAREQHAVHVVHLALQPARDRPQPGDRRHRMLLVGRDVDVETMVAGQRQEAIHHLEPLGPIRVVDPGDLHQLLIFKPRCVTQRLECADDAIAVDAQHHLAHLIDRIDQRWTQRRANRLDRLAIEVGGVGRRRRPHRSMLPLRRIFRCSCMMPYNSASAVGGQPGT